MPHSDTLSCQPTITLHNKEYPFYQGKIHGHWEAAALRKGFDLIARVQDRYHLVLRCHTCGKFHLSKLFVVMNNQPNCPHCLHAKRCETAAAAGLTFLRQTRKNHHYAHFRAPCGHKVRRQFELVERAARGETGIRCKTCHSAREAAEARERGWELIGPDPEGNPNYRLYRHAEGCGATRRIARRNMQTGRFDCEVCGQSWAAAPSQVYLMRFIHPTAGTYFKLGYSRDPASRLRFQLGLPTHVHGEILRTVPFETGHAALCAEKKIHKVIGTSFPNAVVPREGFADWLNVVSEIYSPEAEIGMHRLLDAAAAGTLGKGR